MSSNDQKIARRELLNFSKTLGEQDGGTVNNFARGVQEYLEAEEMTEAIDAKTLDKVREHRYWRMVAVESQIRHLKGLLNHVAILMGNAAMAMGKLEEMQMAERDIPRNIPRNK
jgi:hypothetical protein